MKPSTKCMHPVLDEQKRAKLCGKPAAYARIIEGERLDVCGEHRKATERAARRRRKAPAPPWFFTTLGGVASDVFAARDRDAVHAADKVPPGADLLGPYGCEEHARKAAKEWTAWCGANAPALCWRSPEATAAWLDDLRERVADLQAVAEDQTEPIARRRLGRAAAVQILSEAAHALAQLLGYAARGLPTPGPAPRLRVDVAPGTFASERNVSFKVGEQIVSLIVDAGDVHGDTLRVDILDERLDYVFIQLPRESPQGRRMWVPKAALVTLPGDDDPESDRAGSGVGGGGPVEH